MPRPQFTLRTMLVAMLVGAVAVAWFVQRRDKIAKEAAIARVLSKGGMIGSDRNGTITEVVFAGQRGDADLAARLTDADVESLRALPYLRELDLTDRPITDAAVPTLSRLTRLRVLKVRGTKITHDGMLELRSAMPDCTVIE